jgi:tRNA-dihydrouridine synthase 1
MLHSRLFKQTAKFRDSYFQPTRDSLVSQVPSSSPPWLDGHPKFDRPLFVQFCSNDADDLLEAARYVAPYCDAVDLNLGCPQGIARSGHYGAFLQEDWTLIYQLINKLHRELSIPVTAKIRILETRERTLDYAKMVLSAGASIITVHGRRREQKGHNMGIADWSCIKYLRDHLPPETVIFANGNILDRADLEPCLAATGADGVMSAEGNLSDPTIFAVPPPIEQHKRDYWRDENGQEGYRIDAVIRRYFDIVYQYILETDPPRRPPLFHPSDPPDESASDHQIATKSSNVIDPTAQSRPPKGKRRIASPSLGAIQGHLFQLLRPILSTQTDIRDALSKCRCGNMAAFEEVLAMLEASVKLALLQHSQSGRDQPVNEAQIDEVAGDRAEHCNSATAVKPKKPWWVCQPYIRPLPKPPVESAAPTQSKKDKAE